MSDPIDAGSDLEQFHRELALKNMKANAVKIEATGACLNCFEPLASGLRFCNCDCRNDWQKANPKL